MTRNASIRSPFAQIVSFHKSAHPVHNYSKLICKTSLVSMIVESISALVRRTEQEIMKFVIYVIIIFFRYFRCSLLFFISFDINIVVVVISILATGAQTTISRRKKKAKNVLRREKFVMTVEGREKFDFLFGIFGDVFGAFGTFEM